MKLPRFRSSDRRILRAWAWCALVWVGALPQLGLALKPASSKPPASEAAQSAQPAPARTVWIERDDPELQCEGAAAQSDAQLAAARAELERAGVTVVRGERVDKGLMQVALCGASSGWLQRFEIDATQVARALKLGFSASAKNSPSLEARGD